MDVDLGFEHTRFGRIMETACKPHIVLWSPLVLFEAMGVFHCLFLWTFGLCMDLAELMLSSFPRMDRDSIMYMLTMQLCIYDVYWNCLQSYNP